MNREASAQQLPYTWSDYRTWEDGDRWEILAGEVYAMSPAPTVRHQRIQGALFMAMSRRFAGRRCEVILSPVDVRLSETDVVQPDLVVVCDRRQITETHIDGGPSLVVEILSPSTEQRDRSVKMDAYARAGVREVWLVTPWPQMVEVFLLDGPGYRRHSVYIQTQTLRSASFPELEIDLAPVFDFPLQPGEEPPAVREPPGHWDRCAIPPGSRTG